MPSPTPPRRALAVLRPAPWAIALTLCVGALAVLICVGLWASRLGDPPAWAFDCDDTTCTDLWIDARRYYLGVSAGAGVAAVLGWLLGGFAVPARPVPAAPSVAAPEPVLRADDAPASAPAPAQAPAPAPAPAPPSPAPRGRRATEVWRLLGVMLLAGALLVGAGWLAISVSRPMGLAGAGVAVAVAAGGAWRWMRPGAASDRTAYWMAGAGTGVPLLVLGLVCLHPVAFVVTMLVVAAPLRGIPMLSALLLAGAVVTGRLLPRQAAVESRASGGAARPVPARPDAGRLVTAFAVVALLALGVRAAWPVDAPADDAWVDAARSEAPEGAGTEVGPGGRSDSDGSADGGSTSGDGSTGSGEGTADGTLAGRPRDPESSPPMDASDLPECAAGNLAISAGGWDWWTGNSAGALTATNDGEEACAVRGTPELTLTQSGEEIALRPEPLTHLEATEQPEDGIGLRPGDSARSLLYWPGYRTAADQETPQTLTLRLAPGGAPQSVDLSGSGSDDPETPGSGDDAPAAAARDEVGPGEAPFDLVPGVPGGAVIEVGPWERVPAPAG
ncbi:DUF4232 domain-containing protein [Brachybacterium alimentarium]|uniref:DUF4232 domain-containing protein n=1 Tax=Brachybacterium alimentarium TaxID=47845 RepID=UPI000DF449BF|nr:DUF4232 domain-containing protein [Brachybacterium alimentarium]RCS80111.1 DUF4232 domain-containing protein [Brachybacterium alimentarium]